MYVFNSPASPCILIVSQDPPAADNDIIEDLASKLIKFIQNDIELYRQTLMYEPIWLENLFQRFKEDTGTPVKLNQIQDILDNECITFRTKAQHVKNVKRNTKKK